VGVPVGFAQDAFMGVWKLKEAKSEFSAGAPKNTTVVYEAEGDQLAAVFRFCSSSGGYVSCCSARAPASGSRFDPAVRVHARLCLPWAQQLIEVKLMSICCGAAEDQDDRGSRRQK
jgi:hypothetical protein